MNFEKDLTTAMTARGESVDLSNPIVLVGKNVENGCSSSKARCARPAAT